MTKERLYLFDTTLSDGAQTRGIDFSLEDKILVAGLLDQLGIDYVEGGYPGANPTDTAFFEEKRTQPRAVHRLRHDQAGRRSVSNDPGLQDLLDCQGGRHLLRRQGLGFSRAPRARLHQRGEPRSHPPVGDRCGRGGQGDAARLRAFLRRLQGQPRLCARLRRGGAFDAGARWVVLCDTNGGTLPDEVEAIVADVVEDDSAATSSASTPTTTPARRWPIRSPRSAPARARSRAR